MDSFVWLTYASLVTSRALLRWLLACLSFAFRRFILLLQKKMISMNYGCSTSCWKPSRWVRLGPITSMRDIYNNPSLDPLTKFTSSSRSTEFKDILSWKISQMITNTIPINTIIVISNAMKLGIPLWIWWKVNGNWDKNRIRISQWKKSHCGTNTSVRRKKEIQKSQTVSGIRVGKLTIWVRSLEMEKL